jgi:hypothetical protein
VILGHFRAERLFFNNDTTILLAGGDTKFRSIDSISTKAVACRENEKHINSLPAIDIDGHDCPLFNKLL